MLATTWFLQARAQKGPAHSQICRFFAQTIKQLPEFLYYEKVNAEPYAEAPINE
jgi:hypothetical protein